MDQFSFNISLSVLNHLGRNLYRNFITVVGEAISNSWDADAKHVYITIDRKKNRMRIVDDGIGMTKDDFQEKFLKIGYTKRKNINKSALGRPFIGRKGIGKLALLSCAEKIHIVSKTKNTPIIGGVIDNSDLDKAITRDLEPDEYVLGYVDASLFSLLENNEQGTAIYFESLSGSILNTEDYIKGAIALYFKFSLIDPDFNIYVNGDKIDETFLKDFAENTQFLWSINEFYDPLFGLMKNLGSEKRMISHTLPIKGYIATVKKPSNLKIRGTQEKATLDLFVNGRLRERDLLRHFPTARIVENYVFGQIHYNDLDRIEKDVFTSSREGVISNEPLFKELLKVLDVIFRKIVNEWDELRLIALDPGDPDNVRITPKARKAGELFNSVVKEMEAEDGFIEKGSVIEEWVELLSKEAQFNIPSYTECFISENLLRKLIEYKSLPLSKEAKGRAKEYKGREDKSKCSASISYDVRVSNEDVCYLNMSDLAYLVDRSQGGMPGLKQSSKIYKPLRDAVAHTSILTETAKTQLSTEYENIKSRLVYLLKEMDKKVNG